MAIQIVELLPLPRAKHGNSMVASRARTRVGAHVRARFCLVEGQHKRRPSNPTANERNQTTGQRP